MERAVPEEERVGYPGILEGLAGNRKHSGHREKKAVEYGRPLLSEESEGPAGVLNKADQEPQGAKKKPLLGKGSCIKRLRYYHLSTSSPVAAVGVVGVGVGVCLTSSLMSSASLELESCIPPSFSATVSWL